MIFQNIEILFGSSPWFFSRITVGDGLPIKPKLTRQIDFYLFNRKGPSLLTSGQLKPSDVLFDSLQLEPRWTKDKLGYNFAHQLSSRLIPKPGSYQLEYEVVPKKEPSFSGGIWELEVHPVLNKQVPQSLTEKHLKALEIIRNEGPITGKRLAQKLHIEDSTLRRSYIPKLKQFGVENDRRGDGYYIAPR